MTLYSLLGYINAVGFIWGFVSIIRLTYLYERPTYFDNYFYFTFVVCIYGIITQLYSAVEHSDQAEWFMKSFGCVSWIKVLFFCNIMKKMSYRINIKKNKHEKRSSRLFN